MQEFKYNVTDDTVDILRKRKLIFLLFKKKFQSTFLSQHFSLEFQCWLSPQLIFSKHEIVSGQKKEILLKEKHYKNMYLVKTFC